MKRAYLIADEDPPLSVDLSSLSNTHLHPSLIRSCLSLIEAMRTHFYRELSDKEDDGGGLQWDFTSDLGSVTHRLRNFHKTSMAYKSLGHYQKASALGYRPKT